MSGRSHSRLLVCAVVAVIAETLAPVSAQSWSSTECASQCGTTFGDGTRIDRARQELLHDARYPLQANVTCSIPFKTAVSVSFLYAHYAPVGLESNAAYFILRLDEWRCGVLRFNLSTSCYQDWYLMTGYKYHEPPMWECQSTLERISAEKHCDSLINNSCEDASSSAKLVCQYSLRNLLNYSEAAMCIMSQSSGHVAAAACTERNVPGLQRCISMKCSHPEAGGTGVCISWLDANADGMWTQSGATFHFSTAFGLATATRRFSLAGIALLPEPRHSVVALSNISRSAWLAFCIDSLESEWLHHKLSIATFRIVARTIQVLNSTISSEKINTNCSADEAQCTLGTSGFTVNRCGVNISELHPAMVYYYEVNWQVSSVDALSPWSKTSTGTFKMPDAVPESSPAFTNGVFSEANCSALCRRINPNSTFCRETIIYWKRIPESERNGNLTRVLLYDSMNRTASLPVNSTSYTICSTGEEIPDEYTEDKRKRNRAAEYVHFRLTAENTAGIPDESKWTDIWIPFQSHRMPHVTDIVVRRGPTLGSVQLWWRYTHPVDTFIIFWIDENLVLEPMWIVKHRLLLLAVGSNKWTYILNEGHLGTSNGTTAVRRYGIGAAYNNRSSGIVFSSPCSLYVGDKAPEVEVVGNVISGSTTVGVDVQLAASYETNPCSFAGPVLRLQAALLDDFSSAAADAYSSSEGGDPYTEVSCDNCEALLPPPLGVVARSLLIVGLTSNRKYVIAFRSIVDVGEEEIAGPYSSPVYVRTVGLADDEAAGLGVAAAASIALLGAAAMLLARCHRQLGFGQKVRVLLIRHRAAAATVLDGEFHGIGAGQRRELPLHHLDPAEAKPFITGSGYSVVPVAEGSQLSDAGLCAISDLGACGSSEHKFVDLCTHDSHETAEEWNDKRPKQQQLQQIRAEEKKWYTTETYANQSASDGKHSGKENADIEEESKERTMVSPDDSMTPKLMCLNCAKGNRDRIGFKDISLHCQLEDLRISGRTEKGCLSSRRCLDQTSLGSEARSSVSSSSSLDYLRVSDLPRSLVEYR